MSFEKKTRTLTAKEGSKETDTEKLIHLGEDGTYFTNELAEAYVEVTEDERKYNMKVNSKQFKLFLGRRFYNETGSPVSPDAINQAIHHYESIAIFDGESKKLARRLGYDDNGTLFYDLADAQSRVVRISPDECKTFKNGPSLFYRTKNTAPQVRPVFDEHQNLLELLGKHFRTQRRTDLFLLAVYLVSCFMPDIPHPLLVLAGEQGAAKSTSMRMARAIVDPANTDLLTMPNSTDNLVIMLNNNYMPGFDNLDFLSPERSDLLCMASTGGSISKRTLYSNDEETILQLKRCVMLNGINIVVTRPDLLDRSIIIEFKRIPKEERKDEKEVWTSFHADMPKILGTCLNTLSKAMSIYPNVQLTGLPRMADFAKWGYAIAKAMGYKGERFIEIYEQNQKHASQEVLLNNPVASSVIKMMEDTREWIGNPTTFYLALSHICENNAIRMTGKNWPDSPNALTRRMNNLKSNLEQVGIFFETRKGNERKVILTNETVKEVSHATRRKRKEDSLPEL